MAGRNIPPDVFSEDYDQMSDDFNNPELNCYDSGPGIHLKQHQIKAGENTKLYVRNIPSGLTEEGLRNIFSSEGDIPENVYIHKKPNHQFNTSWGFVTFKSMAAAQSVMSAINKRPPYHFYINLAKCEDEKSDKSKGSHSTDSSDRQVNDSYSRGSITPSSRGRGKLPPMRGQPPGAYKALRPIVEPYIETLGEDYIPGRFSHCGTTFEQNVSNSVFSPYADGDYDDGKRKMTMGRGSYIAHKKILPLKNKEPVKEDPQDMEHRVAAYLGNQTKDFLFDKEAIISSETKLSLPVKPGTCTYCARPAIYICSKCKCWYCTNYCRKKHWNVHKSSCIPRKLEFQNGIPKYMLLSEAPCYEPYDQPTLNDNCSESDGHKRIDYQIMSNGHLTDNKASIYQDDSDNNQKNRKGSADSGGSKKENSRSTPNLESGIKYVENHRKKEENNKKEYIDRKKQQRSCKHIENDIFVKSPLPLLHGSRSNSRMNTNGSLSCSPIPSNVFTKVTVGSVEKNDEFFAFKIDDYPKQASMLEKLNEYCKSDDTLITDAQVGVRCAALFEGDWYRAEIIQKFPMNVKVKYIDFGNESIVMKTDLKKLPQHIATEPVMAHKFVLAPSSNNPSLEQDLSLSIKPVSQDEQGRWIVAAECATNSEQYQEVTISVTENKDVYWVHKSKVLLKLIEMASSLGEHKDVIINEPLIGEIYVHFSNNSWCRAKVISKDPLKIEYIDYGYHNLIEKCELHPLPKKYEDMPSLALRIKLVEGTSTDYHNLKPISKMFIKEIKKLKDGTSVCQVDGNECESNKQVKHFLSLLENNSFATIEIEKFMNDEFLTGSIMDNDQFPLYKDISKIIGEHVVPTKDMKLVQGMTLAAKWQSDWYRGYLMVVRDSKPIVALIDKGRVVVPLEIAPLPKKVLNIPECGVRVIFDSPILNRCMIGGTICVKNIQHNDENNYVEGEEENGNKVVILPWVPALEEAGLDCISIPSGSRVQISAYHSPSAIYIQSCNLEHKTLRCEIVQDVASCMRGEPLKRKALTGEFLACRYIEDGYYYRAQVFKKEGDKYKVNFVDYGNTELVSVEDLKQLPEHLKRVPCCAVKVGLKDVPDVPFNTQCMKFLNELAANSVEMFLNYENDLREVTLDLREGDIVNKILFSFLEPSWEKPEYHPLRAHVYMVNDIKYECWNKGSTFEIAVVSVLRHNTVLALRPASRLLNHVENTLTPNITAFCESTPNEPYNPRRSELCLAKFHEDGKWYRAMCIKSYQHNAAEVFYIDYGNSGEVLHRCIRKMVAEFIETPAVLNCCKIFGLPDRLHEPEATKLKDYLSTLRTEVEVLEEVGEGNSMIWIPELVNQSSQLGITMKCPN